MLDTKNLLNSLILDDPDTKTNDLKSLEQISGEYQSGGLSPLLLAYAFNKTYGLIWTIARRFYGLIPQDIASIALENLDFSLRNYNPEVTPCFTTYFSTILYNALRTYTQSLSTDKRKANSDNNKISYQKMVEDGFDQIHEDEQYFIDLAGYNLNERETTYCILIQLQYTNSEIADILEVSIMTLSNLRKKLKEKLKEVELGL